MRPLWDSAVSKYAHALMLTALMRAPGAGFDEQAHKSQYVPPPTKFIYDYDTPNDPMLSALSPSGVHTGRPVFPHYEPPYAAEKESVRPRYTFSA